MVQWVNVMTKYINLLTEDEKETYFFKLNYFKKEIGKILDCFKYHNYEIVKEEEKLEFKKLYGSVLGAFNSGFFGKNFKEIKLDFEEKNIKYMDNISSLLNGTLLLFYADAISNYCNEIKKYTPNELSYKGYIMIAYEMGKDEKEKFINNYKNEPYFYLLHYAYIYSNNKNTQLLDSINEKIEKLSKIKSDKNLYKELKKLLEDSHEDKVPTFVENRNYNYTKEDIINELNNLKIIFKSLLESKNIDNKYCFELYEKVFKKLFGYKKDKFENDLSNIDNKKDALRFLSYENLLLLTDSFREVTSELKDLDFNITDKELDELIDDIVSFKKTSDTKTHINNIFVRKSSNYD